MMGGWPGQDHGIGAHLHPFWMRYPGGRLRNLGNYGSGHNNTEPFQSIVKSLQARARLNSNCAISFDERGSAKVSQRHEPVPRHSDWLPGIVAVRPPPMPLVVCWFLNFLEGIQGTRPRTLPWHTPLNEIEGMSLPAIRRLVTELQGRLGLVPKPGSEAEAGARSISELIREASREAPAASRLSTSNDCPSERTTPDAA